MDVRVLKKKITFIGSGAMAEAIDHTDNLP